MTVDIRGILGNCVEFSVQSTNWFQVPQPADLQSLTLMNQAPLGAQFKSGVMIHGVRHASLQDFGDGGGFIAQGLVWRTTDDPHSYYLRANLTRSSENPMYAPEDYDAVDNFLQITGFFGQLHVNCVAIYEVPLDDPRVKSRIDLPRPLFLGEQNPDFGMTHVESITLGRREQEGPTPTHVVHVTRNPDNTIRHRVEISFRSLLTEEGLGQMREVTDQTSRNLLVTRRQSQ